MSVLDSHIEAEIAAFVPGSSSANATEVMLIDHSDRLDEIPNVKIAAALSVRTKGLEWLDATERTLWRRTILVECKKLFQVDIAEEVWAGGASNGIGSPEKRGVGGGETRRKKQKRGFLKRCVATAKVVGAGDDEEDGGLDDAVRDAGASSNSTAPPQRLSLTARMQAIEHEL